jgi:hypothetical protein
MIIEYEGSTPRCPSCRDVDTLKPCPDGSPDPMHTFVVGIGKPPYEDLVLPNGGEE